MSVVYFWTTDYFTVLYIWGTENFLKEASVILIYFLTTGYYTDLMYSNKDRLIHYKSMYIF